MSDIHRETGRRNQHAGKRMCLRGHRFTPANTYITTAGSRQCRACIQVARGRARWALVLDAQRARLRAAMIAAHPDHGGTAAKFQEALKAYRKVA